MATTTQASIRLKSYFATSIRDAIDLARRELGPDALLLSSRQAPPEARHLGPIEVVFGDDSGIRSFDPGPPAAASFEDLRQKVDKICHRLAGTTPDSQRASAHGRFVEQALLDAGVTRELAMEIEEAVAKRVGRKPSTGMAGPRRAQDADVVREATEEIRGRFVVKPGIGRVTALVGPPGSGKTTTLVKLALTEGLMKGRRVRLISADAQRIAASEQLRIYAAILGVPFQSAESMSALRQAIDSSPAGELALIDTPGLSPALFDGPGGDLARLFQQRQDIDIHLVLTASMRPNDLERTAARFAIFRPEASIFTKLDETDSFGAVFTESVRSGLPVSYFCDGQLVPENIEPASPDRLAESLVRHLPELFHTAA